MEGSRSLIINLRRREFGERLRRGVRMWSCDHEIAVVVWSVATLDEVRDAAVGGPEGAARDARQFGAIVFGEATTLRDAVEGEEAPMIFDHVSRQRLAQPAAQLNLRKLQPNDGESCDDAPHGMTSLCVGKIQHAIQRDHLPVVISV